MSDNIKVVVKVRPLISREIDDKLGYQWRVNNNTLYQIDQNGKDSGQYYTFDKVYDKDTKTCDVYNDIAKPIVEAATAGFNGTIFAYGQTSSGKTYTMAGTNEAPGIIPLAVFNLFDIIKNIPDRDFLVRVSYVEIYNETLTDLLDLRKNIKIMETLQGVKVDATEKMTTSPEEVLEVMRMGKVNRQTGATNMNEESSRSHSIFQITIESREHIEGEEEVGSVNVSQLNLVDLAGSERSGQTGATGIRFKEGTHINKSLSSLALVIKQLSEDPNKHVNYRDSKLTRILQNSLGGNAKTSIICAVTPAAVEETISTLQFANRAKAIKNNPAVNAVATNVTMIQTLTKQLSALKTQLESKKNVEQDNYNLQKQIGGLQRLILNGFAQRSSTDITGARRKLQQPRRVTISTLHPIQEDPVPSIPKFCTPSLKYNPMSIASTSDFVPIQNVSSLPSVSEELRLITPPPTERNVNFNNEIIEIDSDDDNSTDIQTCSPYHKCYQSSKTPPCVLRKNAKLAEKNFKDIVELTEREKIYTPNIVELMEKLESKSTRIAKLEDEIHKLGRLSNDKDLEMEKLKCNINKMKDEIKNVTSAKADLEEVCKNYNTKLTDWEVSYETLKKKAKTREDELLSLLQEHEAKKKYEKIGKLASKSIERELTNFMDMSRDISLVNSDIENSIINIEEGTTFQVEQPKNNEFQLSIQDQTILDLQSELQSHKSKIDSLETINNELQEIISSYKEKLTDLENENSLHISTIDKLNNNIESQKTVLETINADIDSYNSVIQELQIKLARKENVTEYVDSEIEAMIIKEEMFIANNENIKNIIMSLKAALCARNEEIKELKSSLDTGKTQEMNTTEEELENKKKEISILIQEVERLKTQSNENVSIFDKLLEEKNNLLHMEQHLQIKNTEIEKEKELLEEKIAQHIIEIKELENCKEKLNIHLEEKDREILSIKESKDTEIRTMSAKIIDLEENIKEKDEIITSLQKHEIENQENLNRVQSNIDKFNNIMVLFTGNILAVPEKINDLVSALNTLSDNLSSLETIATDTIAQKKHVVTLLEQRETELELLQSHINDLSDAVDCFYKEYESLTGINHRNGTYSKDSNDMQNINTNPIESLKNNVTNLLAVIKLTQISINQTLRDKETELHELNSKCESKEVELENECDKVTKYMQEIEDLTNERDNLLQNVLEKTTELTSECSVENTLSCQFSSNPQHVYEQIILTLDKIGNHISILNSEREAKYDNIESTLLEAKNEIMKLTEENIKLIQDITNLESSNKTLSSDIKKIQDDSKSLTIDLQISRDLLNQMQQDLTAKSSEIELVEAKAVEWKDKFENLEVIKKKQIEVLRNENIELKSKFSGLQLKDRQEYTGSLKSNQLSTKKSNVYTDINSPPSLLKICCESIIDAFTPNEEDETVSSTSSSIDEIKNRPCLMKICQCEKDLDILKDSNIKLMAKLKQLEDENEYLNKEREEVQKEVQLLVENIYELQKKIVNHRTNLSTLTATTYAENRSLSSQVKFLQHHHNRFHIVCQRDIPDFKNQLQDLLILLKSESLGKLNESLKRYSLPNALETVALHSPLTNESMIDGDLLMLDTNVTLTTCDNTLISHDQTCFDVTQVCTYNEVACQTNPTEISKSNLSYPQMNVQSLDETKISKTIESLKKENQKLRDVVDEYLQNKKSKCLSDAQSSPIKISVNCNDHINNSQDLGSCSNCTHVLEQMKIQKESYESQIELMTNKMTDLESQKVDFETKYQNLSLEIPSSELLVRKLGALEKDNGQKQNEIDKLNSTLDKKSAELKTLQKENDLLSNQIFESISEVDDLKKEHDLLKEININLNDKFAQLESEIERLKYKNSTENQTTCMECTVKNEIISNLKSNVTNSHQKLDRSYSDSDSSSRYKKICTLQNELHAGKEDCIELKEQVTTIKNHLERSNLSMGHAMDLDDSIVDSHICSFNEDFDGIKSNINKYNMPDIPEERPLDNYTIDKLDCFNFYLEKTAADKNTINYDGRIIDVMKMLYETIANKHANEIENLNNKLKDFEESKTEFQMQLNKMSTDQTRISKELKEKDTYFETLANVVSQIRHNIESIKSVDFENIVNYFSDNVLMKVDKEFGFTSTEIFKFIIQQITEKQRTEITKLATDNDQLNITLKQKSEEIQCLQDNLSAMKLNLTEKENNLDHLQRQKEKIHEISAAVTLDIVTRDKVLKDQVIKNYEKLLESKIIDKNVDMALPVMEIINSIFEEIFNNHEKLEIEKQALILKIDELKEILDIKENKLKELNVEFEDLKKICNKREEEHSVSATTVSKLTEDICALKADIANKDALITSLKTKFEAVNNNMAYEVQVRELLQSTAGLQQEIDNLKSINDVILKEKKTCEEELENASAIIKQNKIDIEKLASDILLLKDTINKNSIVTENMKTESERLLKENALIKNQLEEKCKEYSRMEDNIKKHQKTAEIQSGIIIRLKKQKQDDETLCLEKNNQIDKLTENCKILETRGQELANELLSSKDKIDELLISKQLLETRISELEANANTRPRLSIDAMADTTRRRRQSIHDSKRLFSDDEEHLKMEAVFKCSGKVDDLFMDVDENASNRSTPIRLSRGRDSLPLNHDQGERDERPERAQAARRRRQSAHDLRRAAHDNSRESSQNNSMESEVTQLRKQLSSCQQELEELKDKYRELDEECETCAEYLKERDEQCLRLKKEKVALEKTVAELKEKLMNTNPSDNTTNVKKNLVNASVKTDEDWVNLHSVVVDRMSYDMEVEKNKKLMKTVEELRFNKHDLKKTIAKMQKALEKNNVKDSKELETMKAELSACKQELEELKVKYKELDEECETCAEYLRERDEQCRKLKEVKASLELKLQEYHDLSNITHSVRKKRQNLHDKNRTSSISLIDAATLTDDDLLRYHVEKNTSLLRPSDDTHAEIRRLKSALEKLSQQKVALEHQLLVASANPLYVATGSAIIQNQQLTDVMKENQKLKKINAKLVTICKKRGKGQTDANRENEDPLNN